MTCSIIKIRKVIDKLVKSIHYYKVNKLPVLMKNHGLTPMVSSNSRVPRVRLKPEPSSSTDLRPRFYEGIINQRGAIPLLLLIAGIGVVLFLVAASIFPFKNNLLENVFKKIPGFAAINNQYIWLEPENGTAVSPMTTTDDTTASNGKFVSTSVTNLQAGINEEKSLAQIDNSNKNVLGEVLQATATPTPAPVWAFEETFDYGSPASPSQSLLPKNFDYSATHRSHPANVIEKYPPEKPDGLPFAADHKDDCTFPQVEPLPLGSDGYPTVSPDPYARFIQSNQHVAHTHHESNMTSPDQSFFICNNHMMSSVGGQVSGYSLTSFYPKQEFDFAEGGVLEFEVDLAPGHGRHWWEVVIMPKEEFQIAPSFVGASGSDAYPAQRLIFNFTDTRRQISIGTKDPYPNGTLASFSDWQSWHDRYSTIDPATNKKVYLDPAYSDRRIRRINRIEIKNNEISWSIQKFDGTFDTVKMPLPSGLPFNRGLVTFKTHAYTADKSQNYNLYTFHWDNIRFTGTKLPPFENYEAPGVVDLASNGSTPIGSNQTVTINLPGVGTNPVLEGQVMGWLKDQVQLSINGNPYIKIEPLNKFSIDGVVDECYGGNWSTFRYKLDPAQLKVGTNTLKWLVGPRPQCAQGSWLWDGFAVKALEIQFDGSGLTPPTPIVRTDTTPPTLSPNFPPPWEIFTGTRSWNPHAGDESGIGQLELYVNNALYTWDDTALYQFTLDSSIFPDAEYELKIKATDKAGNSTEKTQKMTFKNQNPNLPTDTGNVTIPFSVTETGDYTFWARLFGADANSDSFWLQIDSRPAIKVADALGGGLQQTAYNQWSWASYRDGSIWASNSIIRFKLDPGPHTLKITGREANTKIDKLLLTNDTSFTPSGVGTNPVPKLPPILGFSNLQDRDIIFGSKEILVSASGETTFWQMNFLVDGQTKGSLQQPNSNGLYKFTLNTSQYPDGEHTISAIAYGNNSTLGNVLADVVIDNVPDPSPSASPSPLPSSGQASPTPSPKPGDIDGNNKVDIFDYNILLTDFGKQQPNLPADIDKSGKVDIFDYNLLLTNFGK